MDLSQTISLNLQFTLSHGYDRGEISIYQDLLASVSFWVWVFWTLVKGWLESEDWLQGEDGQESQDAHVLD